MSDWELIQKKAQKFGVVFAVTFNLLVIHLVLNKSPQNLGTYKFLLIFTAAFELAYSILEVVVQPIFHSFGSTFVIIVNVKDSYFNYETLKVLISLYCAFFGSLLATFSIQFVYRYWVVSGNKLLETFNGFKMLIWLLIPVASGSIWGFAAYFPCASRPSSDEYLRKSVMDEFGLKIEENLYIAPYFYEKSQNGTVSIYYSSFIAIVMDSLIINVSIATACIFGFKCYSTLRKSNGLSTSENYKSLQKQLFYSLVTQTLIPIFLMHIPAFSMFVFTFLNINIGPLSGIVTITIALFPAVDPLPTLFIVKKYRRAIQCYISKFFLRISKLFESSSENGASASQNPLSRARIT